MNCGVAATVGNANAIEDLVIGHSIIAGNTVHEIGGSSYADDVFTGSTLQPPLPFRPSRD